MSAKENLNKAFFDIFGVGQTPEEETELDSNENFASVLFASESSSPAPAPAPEEPFSASFTRTSPAAPPAPASKPISVRHVETYLAPGTGMEGRLNATGDVEIAGTFKGDIRTTGNLIIRSNIKSSVSAAHLEMLSCTLTGEVHVSGKVEVDSASVIRGNVYADELVCSGKIIGDLFIKGNADFEEHARVEGSVQTNTMTMSRGAIIAGTLNMGVVDAGKKPTQT